VVDASIKSRQSDGFSLLKRVRPAPGRFEHNLGRKSEARARLKKFKVKHAQFHVSPRYFLEPASSTHWIATIQNQT
jgi:hypothetical protein